MPKMIGSLTFIIVALRCSENSTPFALASSICASMKAASAAADITEASIISPAFTATAPRSGNTLPVALVYSMRRLPALTIVYDCSLP